MPCGPCRASTGTTGWARWLHRILSNVCSDEGNRQRRAHEKTERWASNDRALTPPPSTEAELGLDIDDTELLDAIDNLSEQYREALMLRFVDELSYEEVAQVSGVSEEKRPGAGVACPQRRARSRSSSPRRRRSRSSVLLRRGERAASALSGQTPGSGKAAVNSAMPLLAETAPVASRAAAAAANTAATGVPVVAKAAVSLGLATAVITPTVDSPVHRAADRVLPDSVIGSADAIGRRGAGARCTRRGAGLARLPTALPQSPTRHRRLLSRWPSRRARQPPPQPCCAQRGRSRGRRCPCGCRCGDRLIHSGPHRRRRPSRRGPADRRRGGHRR